jgi:hypothetical protein
MMCSLPAQPRLLLLRALWLAWEHFNQRKPYALQLHPATIKALVKLGQVLDQHRFGAVILILVMVTAGALMAVLHLPAILV